MAIITNAEIWFARLDPKRPNATYDKLNPSWELQIRTNKAEQKKEWEQLGLKPKLMLHKDGTEHEGEPLLDEEGKKQWRVNLRKKVTKSNGEPADPIEVVDGKRKPLDPSSIGNKSIGNIRIFQYTYPDKVTKEEKTASMPTAVQVTKHIFYEFTPREDDFDECETETIMPEVKTISDENHEEGLAPSPKLSPGKPKAPIKPEDEF
jgi:hypothetical protein